VGTVEFARAIVRSLRQALGLAVVVIAALLIVLWRSPRYALFALVPLGLGALLTAALTVAVDLPLNFANVIVLPLVLGIGVDSGIHLVHRHRLHLEADVLQTSTARAVFFSALTSLASFATLSLASHRGISSLAGLLVAGLSLVLVCNLIVLPALLTWLDPPGGSGHGSR
jgi:predicted RND superfamily exporter protein